MKNVKSTGTRFDVEGVTGYIYTNDETGDVTGIGFDHLSNVLNPSGNVSVYMNLAGSGKSLNSEDLSREYNSSRFPNGLLIDYVTSIVIPRERASAAHAFEQEQYEQEHGKPWGFSAAKWVG